jgi:hypothetical protein
MREISPARLPLDGKLIRFENHLFASEPCAARDFDRIALATRYSPHDASTVSPVVRNKKSGGQAPAFPFPFGTCRESIPPMRILQQCFRVYAEEIEAAVRFYEGLQGVACERRAKIFMSIRSTNSQIGFRRTAPR